MLYKRNTSTSYVITIVKISVQNYFGLVIIRGRKFAVGIIQRPPDFDEANMSIQEIARACRYKNVCIMCDFNYWGLRLELYDRR